MKEGNRMDKICPNVRYAFNLDTFPEGLASSNSLIIIILEQNTLGPYCFRLYFNGQNEALIWGRVLNTDLGSNANA